MQIRPVYLVGGPEPARPTRRRVLSWLGVGAAGFVAGAVAGAIGVRSVNAPSEASADADPDLPDHDERLTWAHRVAGGSDQDLTRFGLTYLPIFADHADDPELQRGFDRLVTLILRGDPADPELRRGLARSMTITFRRVTEARCESRVFEQLRAIAERG